MADLQAQRGSNKKMLEKKRLREMVKQPQDQCDDQGYYISFDPLRDGNCQFSSICRILREFGFHCSPEALRAEIGFYFYLFIYLFFPVSLHFLSYILKSYIVAVI